MQGQEFILRVGDYIKSNRMLESNNQPVLMTLSGGADSVALLRVLLDLGYPCVAAHCNFHLRGDESNRDEQFVRELCEQVDVPLKVKHFNVDLYCQERGFSVEMACRELRYEWFAQLALENDCQAIAVAHHGDDNVETFFLNALRGSGIAGIAAMKPRNGNIVRPLLCVTRADVEQFLVKLRQPFIVDSTNLENDFKRNRVRNEVIPVLESKFPGASAMLRNTIEKVRGCANLYCDLIEDLKCRVVEDTLTGCCINIAELNKLKTHQLPLLLFELIKDYGYGYNQCENIAEIIQNIDIKGQCFYSSSHTLSLTLQYIVIEETNHINNDVIKLDFNNLDSLKVKLKLETGNIDNFTPSLCNGKTVVAFDSGLLNCNVVLRHWREGDRMKPFGLRGTKLLSDLFTDAKLSPEARKSVWVMEADGEIVWVLGLRAADVYRVTPNSQSFILITTC